MRHSPTSLHKPMNVHMCNSSSAWAGTWTICRLLPNKARVRTLCEQLVWLVCVCVFVCVCVCALIFMVYVASIYMHSCPWCCYLSHGDRESSRTALYIMARFSPMQPYPIPRTFPPHQLFPPPHVPPYQVLPRLPLLHLPQVRLQKVVKAP